MIIKPLKEESIEITSLERALRRLNPHHSAYKHLEQTLYRKSSGLAGERRLQQLFQTKSFIFDHFLFFDLHILSSGPFQIDCLLLTNSYALIIEMKNIAGDITIHSLSPNLERKKGNGEIDFMRNPLFQLRETMDMLQDFFDMHQIKLPIKGVVVFRDANSSLLIKDTSLPVTTIADLPGFIRRIDRSLKVIGPVESIRIVELLEKKHKDFSFRPISERYGIDRNDFSKGGHCPQCIGGKMKRISGSWRCDICTHCCKTAHTIALEEYKLLINQKITSKEMKDFLECDKSIIKLIDRLQTYCFEITKHKKTYLL